MTDLLTVKEAAARSKVSIRTFWRHLDKNLLGLRSAVVPSGSRAKLFYADKLERYAAVQQKLRQKQPA